MKASKILLSVGLVLMVVSGAVGQDFSSQQKAFLTKMLKEEAKGLKAGMMHAFSTPRVQWFKLSKKPVCFEAKGNKFGAFNSKAEGFLSAIKLVYVNNGGGVTCNKSANGLTPGRSKWGCSPDHPFIGKSSLNTLITTANNEIVFPKEDQLTYDIPNFWYNMEQFDADSKILVFKRFHDPLYVAANQELRLWYGEDLADASENDNDGQTCADVFGFYV